MGYSAAEKGSDEFWKTILLPKLSLALNKEIKENNGRSIMTK